jgi:hypothetical protein
MLEPTVPLDRIRLDCESAQRSKVDRIAASERLLDETDVRLSKGRAALGRLAFAKRADSPGQNVTAPPEADPTVAAYFDITPVPNGDGGDS